MTLALSGHNSVAEALCIEGAAWGYFILNATMAQMCADSMILAVAAIVPPFLSYQGNPLRLAQLHCIADAHAAHA